jgi:23S rRNA A2030 N6-methylase RlmJ
MKRCACLLAAAVVLAGCGGNGASRLSRSAYEAKLRSAFSAADTQLRTHSRAAGSPALVASIASSYGGIASSLKNVIPPTDVQRLNRQLVEGASRQAVALDSLAAKIRGKPKTARERILAQFDPTRITGQQEFDRAVAALEAKGYRFRTSAGT